MVHLAMNFKKLNLHYISILPDLYYLDSTVFYYYQLFCNCNNCRPCLYFFLIMLLLLCMLKWILHSRIYNTCFYIRLDCLRVKIYRREVQMLSILYRMEMKNSCYQNHKTGFSHLLNFVFNIIDWMFTYLC